MDFKASLLKIIETAFQRIWPQSYQKAFILINLESIYVFEALRDFFTDITAK
jgi:hypothetical protein